MGKSKNINIKDGATIHIKTYGSGYPLLLLHGNGGSMNFFSKQIHEFKKENLVICMDTRGHGLSDRIKGGLDFELLSYDVFQVLKKLNINKANILGFSDGANIALVFAKNYPQMINRLILNSPNERFKQIKFRYRILSYIQYYLAKFASFFIPRLKNSMKVYGLLFEEIEMEDFIYEHFYFPTLIIAGEKDCIFLETYKKLSEKIKNSQVVIIKNHGHNVARTNPEEFNKIILNFLK